MVGQVVEVTPEQFLGRAQRAGFKVRAFSQEAKGWENRFIELYNNWGAGTGEERGIREQMVGVFQGVPQSGKARFRQKGIAFAKEREKHFGIPTGGVFGYLYGVEDTFLSTVIQLIPLELERVGRRGEIDEYFDSKVQEEIEAEPEVTQMVMAIRANEELGEEMRAALRVKLDRLRDEREDERGAFRYVAEEREL